MFKRFFAWLKAIFNRGMDKLEDPEIMLDQAKRDMTQALTANREKAVAAIAARNRLQQMLDETVRKSTELENKAAMALKQGNRDLARQLLREKTATDAGLENLRATLNGAQETVDNVKLAIKRQEEEVRKKVAESLQLKAQWKQAQIQESITKALQGLTFEDQYEGSFASARDKIANKQAEAQARTEMYAGSLEGKMMSMEDQSMDLQADEELRKLEERLGMAGTPTTPTVSSDQSVDAQLDELERKLQQGQGPQ